MIRPRPVTRRCLVVLLAAAVIPVLLLGASSASASSEDPCGERFALLRAALRSGAFAELGSTGKTADGELAAGRAAIERELRIEQALWVDELDHQRRYLRESGQAGGPAWKRLSNIAARVTQDIEAVRSAMKSGSDLPEEARDLLLACTELHGGSQARPLSAGFDRIAAAERLRPELSGRRAPDAHLDPPSDELRQSAARAESLSKSEQIGRPDPVTAKVTELQKDPVAIYGFVLDQIRPAHYYGSMRSPASTLVAGEGNDADQAALLAALLRTAGHPARVVWGVLEVPTEALLAHYGRTTFTELEQDLTQIGIPWDPVLVGGRPRAYRLSRVWCEVWIPFDNYRGVIVNGAGPVWLALDPYLKTVGPFEPGSVLDDMGLDATAFASAYLAGSGCPGPLDQPLACSPPRDTLVAMVDAFLAPSDSSYAEAAVAMAPRVSAGELLPSAMVGSIVEVGGFGFDLEPGLQHRVRLVAREGQRVLLDHELPVSALSGEEAMLWFVPATIDDEAVAMAYRGLWRTPPYLVNVSVQLRAGAQEVVRGDAGIGMGRPFELEMTLSAPDGSSIRFVDSMRAGVPAAFGMAPGEQGYQTVLEEPSSTSEVMSDLADQWLADVARFEDELANLAGEHVSHRFPSLVVMGSVVRAQGTLGLIERLVWDGIYLDADVHGSRLTGPDNEQRRWLELVQLEASAREGLLFEGIGTASISADKALVLAARQGVTVHHVHAGNLGAILPTLPFEHGVLDEIEGWVQAGGEAWVPAEELSLLEWSGVGYRLIDPVTGEGRYQLTGRLSGAMIAAPWFTVSDDTRYPIQYPSTIYTNPDPGAAVGIQLFDGNLQVGEAGEVLSDANGKISLKVLVTDIRDRPVQGAQVELQVLAGGGGFGGPGVASTTATSNAVGIAEVPFTLGTDTTQNPYYLLFPDDEHVSRCDLSVITASVNGRQMPDLFWEMARPGEVTQILAPRGTSTTALPHMSAPMALVAVPADQYSNPVSNIDVSYTLSGSVGQNGEGPELLGRLDKEDCKTGTIVAGECPGGSTQKTEMGGISGTWVYLVVGDSTHTVTATVTTDSGQVSKTYTGTARTSSVPGGWAVGWPTVLVSRRAQPINDAGQVIEAYPPGETSLPLDVSLLIVRQDFTVTSCGSNRWCTSPSGTYKAKRLSTDAVPDCAPEGCGSGTIQERGQIRFSMPGAGSVDVSTLNANGQYSTTFAMPSSPGQHIVTVAPTIWVGVPKIPSDPDEPNEIVACPDSSNACGAQLEIMEVSDSGWQTGFELWTVLARMTPDGGPLPLVKLGHDQRHEEETPFTYEVLPDTYPALDTTVLFLEEGAVRNLATAPRLGTGQAILPTGKLFSDPASNHQAMVLLNRGWVWQLFPGDPTPMEVTSDPVDFPVILADLDIDADNDDAVDDPERDDLEDFLEDTDPVSGPEELPPGKLMFVNHNDDNNSRVPDYAELEIEDEASMVPIVLELDASDGEVGNLEVTFIYDGPAKTDLPAPDYEGNELGFKQVVNWDSKVSHRYADYEPVKLGSMRIWNVDSADAQRTADDYIEPNVAVSASSLGFSTGETERTFWVEAINGIHRGESLTAASIQVEVSRDTGGGDGPMTDTVRVFPIEGNLGVNCSNEMRTDHLGNPHSLRVGVPDANFDIDEHDERVEDQGDGFRFWRSSAYSAWDINMEKVEDLAPMLIEVPQELIDAKLELALRFEHSPYDDVIVSGTPEYFFRLDHIRYTDKAEDLIDLVHNNPKTLHEYGTAHLDRMDLKDRNEMVFFIPNPSGHVEDIRSGVVQLVARPEGTRDWMPVDSFRLTAAPIDSFFAGYSGRGDDTDNGATVTFSYPTEEVDGVFRNVTGKRFPDAYRLDGSHHWLPTNNYGRTLRTAVVNDEIHQYLIWLHGYNVPFVDAMGWGEAGYKRLYWVGYRGNFVLFTWRGNPVPMVKFGLANHWGLQTSETFRRFVADTVLGSWGVSSGDVTVAAHSLGNLVVYDAMRLNMAGQGNPSGGRLFQSFVSIEAAVWGETMWPQAPVQYCPGGSTLFCDPILYSVRDLQCSSWTFWFNQSGQEATRSATEIHHSYSAGDNVLTEVMRMSEIYLRQGSGGGFDHYNRPQCATTNQFRVPWTPDEAIYADNPGLDYGEWWGRSGCPAMLKLDCRSFTGFCGLSPVWTHFIMPLGAAPHSLLSAGSAPAGVYVTDLNAMDYDWDDGGWAANPLNLGGGHGNCKDEDFPDIYQWWRQLTRSWAVPMEMEMESGR